ncbi:hypothetical protein RUM44_003576 [Polyplax serrata]|uniref:Tight junction-associated protein 1 n=1 Tax=Polyplax serrata TaxID=468196 RepID=A0ABR1AIA6_POLSC
MAQGVKCKECGCSCKGKTDQGSLHLHVEIENLKQKLVERENHIMRMETNFLTEVDKYPNGEYAALAEELLTWQDKYSRLYEAHKRVQKVNQNLEDKLLKIVDKCETEKSVLTKDIAQLEQKLSEANSNMIWLKEENERNRNDVNLAIQLLQCKPSNFVPQKFESLPVDLQQKVKLYMSNKKKCGEGNNQPKHEVKTIKVPIPTFPPTAMFYSVNKSIEKESEDQKSGKPVDIVSAAIMAKILEEREKERQNKKHCGTCVCPLQRVFSDQSCQTEDSFDFETSHMLIDNHGLFGAGKNHLVKVETYQSQSPSVSSAILIERTCIPIENNNLVAANNNNNSLNNADGVGVSRTPKRNDLLKLNVGRNRYHSSKLSRGVNRGLCENGSSKKEKPEEVGARNSEVHIDGSVRFSDKCRDVAVEVEPDSGKPLGLRRCSVSVQMGTSNILLDNVTCFSPVGTQQPAHPYALVHRSRSTSDSGSSNEEISDRRPTETRI